MTSNREEEMMIFVRVPKTGSFLMNHLIDQLSSINNFTSFWTTSDMPKSIEIKISCKNTIYT